MFKKTVFSMLLLIFLFSMSLFAATTSQYTPDKTYYVDAAVSSSGAGTSLATAFKTISEAITAAAAAGAPTAGWGHIILVKPGAYTENLSLTSANLVGLKIMSTDESSWPVVTGAATGTPEIAIGAASDGVVIKGLKFKAMTGQSVAIATTAATCIDYRFVSCYFDINGIATQNGIEITAAQAHSAGIVQFENCTIDMSAAGNAKAAISVAGAAELNDFTVLGCTITGNSANVASAANATIAFQNAAATLFGKTGAGVNLLGNTFNYARVLIQTAGAVANNNDKLKILGNYFNQTDGVQILASGEVATQFGNKANISYNHFNLNYTGATIPFAIRLEASVESIPVANYTITYNHIERTQKVATDATAHMITALYAGGTTAYAGNVPQDLNYWGSATGNQTPAGASAVGAYASAGFAAATSANYLVATYATPPIIDPAKGIQYFDIDNDGHIDKAVIFMKTAVVDPGSLPGNQNDGLLLGSGYVITSVHMDTKADATNLAVALYLQESQSFDTSVLPEVTYSAANNASTFAGLTKKSGQQIASWTELSAAEVDKAAPVLIKAETLDTGIGTGIASNGFLDGIKFTFSEKVHGVRAANAAGDASYAGGSTASADSNLAITVGDISFNQGSMSTTATNVYTLPIGEVRLNTGLTPTVIYKVRNDASGAGLDIIADFAKDATGADTWNTLYAAGQTTITINVLDSAPLVVSSVQTADSTPDGKIDKITVTFSENVASFTSAAGVKFISSNPAFGSGATPQGEYTIASFTNPSGSSSVVEFTLNPNSVATTFDTEAAPEFRYTTSSTAIQQIKDNAGVQLANYGSDKAGALIATTQDKAKPYAFKIETMDALTDTTRTGGGAFASTGANGRIDGIKVYFSENVTSAAGITGTNLDALIAQFALTHSLTSATLSKVLSTAVVGVPTLTVDSNTDQTSVLTIPFLEQSHVAAGMVNGGDTGAAVTAVYTAGAAANQVKDSSGNLMYTTMPSSTDKAAPFIVQGIGKNWYSNAFSDIKTLDSVGGTNGKVTNNALNDYGDGDGYIDGFEAKFTESVTITSAATADSVKSFTSALGTALPLAVITGSGSNTITIKGTATKAGSPDTGTMPALSFDGKQQIKDGTGNVLAAFTAKPVSDGCPPTMVSVLQNGSTQNQLLITFSEPVYLFYPSSTINAPVDSVGTASNTLFSYTDTASGGASTTSATYVKSVTGLSGDKQWIVALDGNLTAADIASSSVWVKGAGIYDQTNAVETGLSDNQAIFAAAGTNADGDIKIRIMDDVVAPFIQSAETMDTDGDGLIDHIKLTFNEAVKDTTMNGYVRQNTMGNDISSTFIISGYTGTVKANYFTDDAAGVGKEAAAAAGEPVFTGHVLNDSVMYLEIQEGGLTPYAETGLGTTGYTGTISFGTPTLTDMSARANVLDTTFGTVAAAAKGKIVDKVGPVLVKAEWANSKLYLYYSEAIADTGSVVKCVHYSIFDTNLWTFTGSPATAVAAASWALNANITTLANVQGTTYNYRSKIATMKWVSPGRQELTMTTSSWPQTSAWGIQLSNLDNVVAGVTNVVFKDAAVAADGVTAAPNTSIKYTVDPSPAATWYTVGNKGCPFPYVTVPKYDYLSLQLITGINEIILTAPTAAKTIVDSAPYTVTWTAKTVTSCDVYISYNNGTTFTKLNATPITTGSYVWTNPVIGTNMIFKVMSADATVSSVYSGVITVISGTAAPVITMVAPQGGEVYQAGTAVNIMWTSANVDSVDVFVSADASNWGTAIARVKASVGNYVWTATLGKNLLVKIADKSSTVSARSSQVFLVQSDPVPVVTTVAKALLNPVPSNLAAINNSNVTRVAFTGSATPGDSIKVKVVDVNGASSVEVLAVVNAAGNFTGTVNASSLANGMVTLKAGKQVNGAVAMWYTFADYLKDASTIGAPTGLVVFDVPADNGGFVYATFVVSANHPGLATSDYNVVKSYEFYKRNTTGADTLWTAWAQIPAYSDLQVGNKLTVIIPTLKNAVAQWKVVASTVASSSTASTVASGASLKVAELLDGVSKSADGYVSAASAIAVGGSVDDIAPSALTVFSADNNPGNGVKLTWTPNIDHGVVGSFTINEVTVPIYGVDKYEVYRAVKGTTTFTLVGFAGPGSASYIDATAAAGTTVYDYYIKLVDGNDAHVVKTADMLAMSAVGGADFTSSGTVGLDDLVLIGSAWGTKRGDANWVSLFDLNNDGVVNVGDLVALGSAWGTSSKSAKVTSTPTVSNPFELKAQVNENNSMYLVNINVKDAATLNGVAFSINYDTKAFEFVKESVTGLVGITLANENKPGVIDVASYFQNEKFNGTITLGFKSKGLNSDMNIQMVNPEISVNNEISAVTGVAAMTLKALPTVYGLNQNFPNPFNPSTTIEYSIPKTSRVELAIYNMAGQKVTTLVNTTQAASFYRVVWNGRNDAGQTVASGLYFYKLSAGNYSKVVKMNLIK